MKRLLDWLALGKSKFYQWKSRYGKVNEHNGKVPRDYWLEESEKQAILEFHERHPLEGYRRLTFMMLDAELLLIIELNLSKRKNIFEKPTAESYCPP
jgi:putative transposase